MSGPSVYLSWPTAFTPLPDNLPPTLPPPVKERTFRSPFGIDKDLYNFVLRPEVPFTVAGLYIVTVFALNAYNRRREHKPWWIARQKPFQFFVVVHNILLMTFSAATFAAMVRAIVHTWPGLDNVDGAAGIADALCKMHGPRGLGDAATYNTTINIWEAKNQLIKLGANGNPDPTDVGRLWNEGLAFWGWLFYVSKFYEVIDTLIILAKGKRSATLQTYHHSGAMLCMWAGIRYMSPPIWMFVFVNSFIHAMMYTYFTLSALGYRVPQGWKRALTSLQIAQFVWGASYAAAHLFVAYDIPVATSYQVASTIKQIPSYVSSAVEEVASTASAIIETPTAAAFVPLIKKLLLRAAGEEGIAERVHNRRGELTTPKMEEKIEHFNEQTYETRWRTDYTKVNCIDTTGEAFAIYLNLLYLAPLTVLFARFFIRAYTQRGKPRNAKDIAKQTEDSAKQAKRDTENKIESLGEKGEDIVGQRLSEVKRETENLREQLKEDVKKLQEGKLRGDRRVSDRVKSFEGKAKSLADKTHEKVHDKLDKYGYGGDGSGSGSQSRGGSPSKTSRGREEDESAIEEEEGDESKAGDAEPKREDAKSSDEKKAESSSEPKPEQSSGGAKKEPGTSKQDEEKDQSSEPSTSAKDEPSAKPDSKDEKPASADSKNEKPASSDNKQEKPSPDSKQEKPSGSDNKNKKPSNSDGKSDKPSDSNNKSAKSAKLDDTELPADTQDANIADTAALRPAPEAGTPSGDPSKGDSKPAKNDKPKSRPATPSASPSKPNNNSENRPPSSLSKSNIPRVGSPTKGSSLPRSSSPTKLDNRSQQQAKGGADKGKAAERPKSSGQSNKGGKPSGKENQAPAAKNESAAKQEANMADSKALRPGSGTEDSISDLKQNQNQDDKDDKDDTDAMGKSGSIIDLAREKAKDAQTQGESKSETEDPAADAQSDGKQWKPPGADGS